MNRKISYLSNNQNKEQSPLIREHNTSHYSTNYENLSQN